MYCDLHMHSTASDGTHLPEALPALAAEAGVAAIALTDHDTTAGLNACAGACAAVGIDFVAGIELAADPASVWARGVTAPPRLGAVHLLGYYIEAQTPQLSEARQRLASARAVRNPQIVERLQSLGIDICQEQVLSLARASGATTVGRPHIAQCLLDRGYVRSLHEAFVRYLGQGAAAYVARECLSADAAIDLIHTCGGLAVLAHPGQMGLDDEDALDHVVRRMRDQGLDGLEVRHSDDREADSLRWQALASRHELLMTGGSDYHGTRKNISLNQARVPYAWYDRLAEAYASRTSVTLPSAS